MIIFLSLLLVFSCGGVYAAWYYEAHFIDPSSADLSFTMGNWRDVPEKNIEIVDKFLHILNNKQETNIEINDVTYTDSYDALIAAFNSSPRASGITLHNNSFIGTMQQTGDDAEALRTLFGSSLLNEETQTPEYQLMLKREAIDGDTKTGMNFFMDGDHGWKEENKYYAGNEMILFSTHWKTDPEIPEGYVIVYATVYTRYPKTDENGNYLYERDQNGNIRYHTYVNQYGRTVQTNYPIYQYGEWENISGEHAFVGYAQVVAYSTGDQTRSFATGTWRSLDRYYGTPVHSTLNAIIQAIPD
ncbi:MAG: hypothetical protein E7666_02895 [Ruminococcaceae bacterium]|nr:hypothetical protein [Oscillospiraceae bacterium]